MTAAARRNALKGKEQGTAAFVAATLFTFRDVEYVYSQTDHIRLLAAYEEAKETPDVDTEVVLFPDGGRPNRETVNLLQFKRLVNKMNRCAKRMARARIADAEPEAV